ncbi:MAG: hypothetical protein EOP49_41075 [Sphingobacteriales bacterium]|nr:MAG: hypothetical protein EOP49_41075 [Sphingobacteriales bacterium]
MGRQKIYIAFCFFIMFVVSCKKNNDGPAGAGLTGRWTMTRVHDKTTGADLVPPAGSSKKVYLDLMDGRFSGKTMRNTITDGTYTMPDNRSISFGTYQSTLVTEDEWGGAFATMLLSCMLQSFYPCQPAEITWQSNRKIEINTRMRYTVTLEKM